MARVETIEIQIGQEYVHRINLARYPTTVLCGAAASRKRLTDRCQLTASLFHGGVANDCDQLPRVRQQSELAILLNPDLLRQWIYI